jgi:hypothetical protein
MLLECEGGADMPRANLVRQKTRAAQNIYGFTIRGNKTMHANNLLRGVT